jgi:hypothetical protein
VAAFEARLADATQDALDSLLHRQPANARAGLEQLRIKEFQMAMDVAQASRRWLELATNPRRRQVSLTQICRLMELASHLARLAAGMPTGDEPRRRPRKEDRPGYWTAPSVEEALEKIYGSKSDAASATPDDGGAGCPPPTINYQPSTHHPFQRVGLVTVPKVRAMVGRASPRAVPQVKTTLHLFQRVMPVTLRKELAAMLGVVGPEPCVG